MTCKDFLDKEYEHSYDLKYDLLNNFYPDAEIIEESEYIKGLHKYTWNNYIVILYFNSLYKFDIESVGNGGWLSIDTCKVLKVSKVTLKLITESYEVKIWVES